MVLILLYYNAYDKLDKCADRIPIILKASKMEVFSDKEKPQMILDEIIDWYYTPTCS